MSAGIICAYISGEIAGAFFSVVGIRRNLEVLTDSGFKRPNRHAAGTVRTESFKRLAFTTWFYDYVILLSDFHKGRSDGFLIIQGDGPCLREKATFKRGQGSENQER
jgi:hypothetical protein